MQIGIVSMLLNGYSTKILYTINSFIFTKSQYSSINEIAVRKTSWVNQIRLITIYIKLTQVFLFIGNNCSHTDRHNTKITSLSVCMFYRMGFNPTESYSEVGLSRYCTLTACFLSAMLKWYSARFMPSCLHVRKLQLSGIVQHKPFVCLKENIIDD